MIRNLKKLFKKLKIHKNMKTIEGSPKTMKFMFWKRPGGPKTYVLGPGLKTYVLAPQVSPGR